MEHYVSCKACKEKISVEFPRGTTHIQGNVGVGSGIRIEGGSISFGPGGSLSFGPGGRIEFGAPAGIRVTCPKCGQTIEYSSSDVVSQQ